MGAVAGGGGGGQTRRSGYNPEPNLNRSRDAIAKSNPRKALRQTSQADLIRAEAEDAAGLRSIRRGGVTCWGAFSKVKKLPKAA